MIFEDRRDAGRKLGSALMSHVENENSIILALPRGGVPVAYEAARELGVPMDILLVRKLGVPGQEELAMGAIGSGGIQVLNKSLINMLGIPEESIDAVAKREDQEMKRSERIYRGNNPALGVEGKTVIIVDDGLATGATMRAAAEALRARNPVKIIVAAPVASPDTCEALNVVADEVVCLQTPQPFSSVGQWYKNFDQTSDQEVTALLNKSNERFQIDKAAL
jgi:predicted phosphoribosyltransferase